MALLDLIQEAQALAANAEEQVQTQEFLHTLAANPFGANHLADLVSQWGDQAPTLPPGAIFGLASSGIGPTHPVGQQVIKNAVPALAQPKDALDRANAGALGAAGPVGMDQQTAARDATLGGSSPSSGEQLGGFLGGVAHDIGSGLSTAASATGHAIAAGASDVGSAIHKVAAPANFVASGGHPQEAGFGNKAGAEAVARDAFTAANTGYQGLQTAGRLAQAAITQSTQGSIGGDYPTFGGGKLHVGTLNQLLSPKQFTLYNQLHGASSGTGILPGGQASAEATQAAQEAANINGHALTPGRALAMTVVEPGTRPFSIISGATDAYTAMNLDPMSNALKFGSESVAASHVFAPLTDEAATSVANTLADYAGNSADMKVLQDAAGPGDLVPSLVEKIKADPSLAVTLGQKMGVDPRTLYRAAAAPKTGIVSGLRPFVRQQTTVQWLSSKGGQGLVDRLAGEDSFSAVRKMLGDDVPVDVVNDIAHTDNPDTIRGLLASEAGTAIAGPIGYRWTRPPTDLRLFKMMPKGAIDLTDHQQAVDQMTKVFAQAKVPTDVQDTILSKLAGARTTAEAYDAVVNDGGKAIEDQLVQGGMPRVAAKKLSTFYQKTWQQDHMFNVDASGQVPRVAGATVDGEPLALSGPHLENEVGRLVPPLDYRALRQATTPWRQALHLWNDGYVSTSDGFAGGASRVAHQALQAENFLAGQITGLFKLGVLSAVRLPVRFLADEQAAMAVGGVDSMFNNPLSYMAYVAGKKGTHDILGDDWVDQLGDDQSAFARSLGRSAEVSPSPWSSEQQILKEYVHYGKDDPENYLRGWTDELSQLHLSAPGREVARALLDPEYQPAGITSDARGIDAVKEWATTGAGQKFINELQTGHSDNPASFIEALRSGQLSPADYIDSVRDRVMTKTGGDQKLLNAVAYNKDPETGDIPFDFTKANQKLSKSTSHEIRTYMGDKMDELGPTVVKARSAIRPTSQPRLIDWAGQKMLGALMDAPSRTLTRSPAFRQFYYGEVERMLPTLTRDAQDEVISQAADDGIHLAAPTATGAADVMHVDAIAKARSLAKMHDYLYYPGEGTTAEDMLRNVMPFSSAWKSVIQRWGKLSIENPQIIRHAQQGIQSLQTSGFFYKDPSTGKEVFNIPAPLKELTGATGFQMQGPVSGLNIVGNGLPGVGPAVQIPASVMIPSVPATQWIRQRIAPYGTPDYGNTLDLFFPGYIQKMQAGKWEIPGSESGPLASVRKGLSTLIPQTPEQKVTVQDLAKQAFTTMANSGAYHMSDPNVLQQMVAKANQQAQSLFFWRGLAQFALPTAPTYSAKVVPKDGPETGQAIFLYKIAADYQTMLKANNYDSQKTTLQFVNKYGPNLIYATESDNLRTTYGIPTSVEGLAWQQNHGSFVSKYPNVWGYFAPQGGAFSQSVYQEQIQRGLIQPVTTAQFATMANAKIGAAIYDQLRSRFSSVTKADQTWLDQQKVRIEKQYPGYGQNVAGVAGKATLAQKIQEMSQAVDDPLIAQTPEAQAAKVYLGLRQEALNAAGRKTLTGATMAQYRTWLYDNAQQLLKAVPDFAPIWDGLFQTEVAPGTTPVAG